MTMQYSVAVRNARLDTVESTIGTTPILELRSGPPPANCAAADSGTLLAQLTLPSDWLAAAASGAKAKSGTWSGTGAGTGVIAHFRIKRAGSPDTTDIQGTVGASGSPTYDMVVDNVNVADGQAITVNSFTLTAGNA
jgi:hypothetical protein